MQCPYCKDADSKVVDSRASEGSRAIRRRRECLRCGRRFTTFERVEEGIKLAVIKKDGSRVPYDRRKILAGIRAACHKQPVSVEAMDAIVDEVEEELIRNFDREVPCRFIGERVAGKLRRLNHVAYIRFASVYREFKDVGEFIETVQDVIAHPADSPGQQELF